MLELLPSIFQYMRVNNFFSKPIFILTQIVVELLWCRCHYWGIVTFLFIFSWKKIQTRNIRKIRDLNLGPERS